MRVGQNPAKFIESVDQPEPVTVAVLIYIPFLEGYYSQSLEVLKTCLDSLWQNTLQPYDLLVFDNASCPEVRQYLQDSHQAGKIQYLLLSSRNIGKSGAWNLIFSAAPGEYLAYADSDIYFYPGWLPAHLKVLEAFPNAGMVTGLPMWSSAEYSTSTIEWAKNQAEARLERGQFLPWEDYWRHASSLGMTLAEAQAQFAAKEDLCLFYNNQKYYVGAGHFQFVGRRQILQSVLPFPARRPMGDVRLLDVALNERGYLRLSTAEWWVQHLGNTLQGFDGQTPPLVGQKNQGAAATRGQVWDWKPVRKFLLWVYNRTFEILFRN